MANAKCPMCGGSVKISSTAKKGSLVYCDSCDAELEIVSLKPLELDWPLEDYEDDFDDDGYESVYRDYDRDYEDYDYEEDYDDD